MQLINCRSCGRLLGKGIYTTLEIKCPRCKTINLLSISNAPLDCRERQISGLSNGEIKRV
ncbi:Com family DNA-binding transcriptional regulator [Acinetobacter sp.]|uniref:Com family DNA-binding transcriptional regulator n=1 Tax=Acinetobacter sp. TaxID=472 RepID=UPI00338DCDC2